MACPIWGDGTVWGDGTLWCRLFGSRPYYLAVERQLHHLAVEVAHSGVDFIIDRLTAHTRVDGQVFPRYVAHFDLDTGEYVSVEVSFSGGNFRIDSLRLVGQVKHKTLGNT